MRRVPSPSPCPTSDLVSVGGQAALFRKTHALPRPPRVPVHPGTEAGAPMQTVRPVGKHGGDLRLGKTHAHGRQHPSSLTIPPSSEGSLRVRTRPPRRKGRKSAGGAEQPGRLIRNHLVPWLGNSHPTCFQKPFLKACRAHIYFNVQYEKSLGSLEL